MNEVQSLVRQGSGEALEIVVAALSTEIVVWVKVVGVREAAQEIEVLLILLMCPLFALFSKRLRRR